MRNFKKSILAASVVALVPNVSYAQLEEVLVTATKREASVQDLPFSVNAQSEQEIQRQNASSLEDLSRNVAGLTIQNLGPGQSQVAIRGVSAGQIVRDQPGVKEQVGVYLDESVISLSLFTPDIDLYDLNRVETLRGPQGTLFGSGSIGGTVRFITNQPQTDEFSGKIEADANTVDDGSSGGHLKGAVNIPMTDSLALRLVGYGTQYPGYIDALGENGRKSEDVNDGERYGGRAALRWDATDTLTITPRIVYQNLETDGFARQEVYNLYANPYTTTRPAIELDEREQYLQLDEAFDDETTIADLVVNWGLDSVDITYVGSYTEREILVSRDASALTGSVSVDLGYPDSAVLFPSNLRDTTDLEQWTHELRFTSNGDGPLQWVVGGFYSDTDRDYAQRLPTPGYDAVTDAVLGEGTSDAVSNGFGVDSPFNSDLAYTVEQTAVFGEINYAFTDRLDVTVGGRWYDFEDNRSITSGGLFANGDTNAKDETSSDGFTPRIMASYDLSDEVTLNAQASEGFRLGGVNDPLNPGLCSPQDEITYGPFQQFDDETLWNYELGFKSKFDSISVNAAIFYTDIEDLQVNLDAGGCSSRVAVNVPDAHTLGGEIEMDAYLTDALRVTFAGSYVEAEFDSDVLDANGVPLPGLQDGNRIASVPEWQFSLGATYTFGGLLGAEESFVSAWWQMVGERYTQPGDQEPGAGDFAHGLPFGGATGDEVTSLDLELDDYSLVNINAGLVYDAWDLMVYVDNVTDENADLSFNRERGGRARLAYFTNQPRTYGITARYNF
ncbi:MAG: TonB-dependent receptor [Halieaceae bacterium]